MGPSGPASLGVVAPTDEPKRAKEAEMGRVLVACEFSGIVREAFNRAGHETWSVDVLPSEIPGRHIQGDVLECIRRDWKWDLMIAFPPCTYLASSGARWWSQRQTEQTKALEFVADLVESNIVRLAIENPVGLLSTAFRKPDQIVQPWMFGHGETKATCLWLYELPKLVPTNLVDERRQRTHMEPDSRDRWKRRSRTLTGLADAMAQQWGSLL